MILTRFLGLAGFFLAQRHGVHRDTQRVTFVSATLSKHYAQQSPLHVIAGQARNDDAVF